MSIGLPLPRPDGRAKVTGQACYAADHAAPDMLHAAYARARIPAGRIVRIDAAQALAEPGVVRVLTASDMPRLPATFGPPAAVSVLPMQDDTIRHEGQPIAIVLAETPEAARHGAELVRVETVAAPFIATPDAPVEAPREGAHFAPVEFDLGDAETGLADAAHRLDAEYSQAPRHHNPMESSATLAEWDGDGLTVHDAVQHATSVQMVLATAFGLDPANVRVICPHTGGGFGCKGYVWPHQILAAAAARVAGRPVKLVLPRADMFANIGYQPPMRQRVSLGANVDGTLQAMRHHAENLTSVTDDFVEFATLATKSLYATPSMALRQRVRRAHVNLPTPMRAPVEGPGTWALESAMDELAHALKIDPLELRLRNHADADPSTGKPWSSKKLREAYEEGARLFGWRDRPRMPARDGDWVLGTGMATCTMGTFRFPARARVRLQADGGAVVETSVHDIGTGTYTIMPQIAADALGIDPARVTLRAGDTSLPVAGPTYGSSSTMGTGSAVLRAAQDAREQLARLSNAPPGEPIAESMRRAGIEEVIGEGSFDLPGDAAFEEGGHGTPYAIRTFGAIFVEVAVDPELGLLRLRRVVGSYSAGRIINPRTARSQITGGIIWGWGMAAMEASQHEPAHGRWLSKNLSGVAVPVNADIPADISVHFVDEFDGEASPLGAKGIGELGATGVAAAVANAVFHATGRRVRSLPITPAALIGAA